jgi:hypothetical protein
MSTLPTDSEERKDTPLASGVLDYFPAALAAVAQLSRAGNDKHNPGEEMHHARGKSSDHADCIIRHLADRGLVDSDGFLHEVKVAWRALALLQESMEDHGAPLARGAREPDPIISDDDYVKVYGTSLEEKSFEIGDLVEWQNRPQPRVWRGEVIDTDPGAEREYLVYFEDYKASQWLSPQHLHKVVTTVEQLCPNVIEERIAGCNARDLKNAYYYADKPNKEEAAAAATRQSYVDANLLPTKPSPEYCAWCDGVIDPNQPRVLGLLAPDIIVTCCSAYCQERATA